jgi:hypothetical protein
VTNASGSVPRVAFGSQDSRDRAIQHKTKHLSLAPRHQGRNPGGSAGDHHHEEKLLSKNEPARGKIQKLEEGAVDSSNAQHQAHSVLADMPSSCRGKRLLGRNVMG